MVAPSNQLIISPYHGSAALTHEQFLFNEMRITAKLMLTNSSNEEIISKIKEKNLFQYPTEKMVTVMAYACLKRLQLLCDDELVSEIANAPASVAKQICLYSIMKQNQLVRDFMIKVIGDKYCQKDYSFGKIDINLFFLRIKEQDTTVASWGDSTIKKICSVLIRILVENEYLSNSKAQQLNPVLINPILENSIRQHDDTIALAAFNCFD